MVLKEWMSESEIAKEYDMKKLKDANGKLWYCFKNVWRHDTLAYNPLSGKTIPFVLTTLDDLNDAVRRNDDLAGNTFWEAASLNPTRTYEETVGYDGNQKAGWNPPSLESHRFQTYEQVEDFLANNNYGRYSY